MKYAVIAVTVNGVKIAQQLKNAAIGEITVFAKTALSGDENIRPFTKMRELMKEIFFAYDALVFCCAAGIAVRMIAPYINSKDKDPAVVVVDEQANFAISLLSGHLGGANEFTGRIAGILQAVPVITTATDVNGLIAPDIIARKLNLRVEPLAAIKLVNSKLLEKGKIPYYIDEKWPRKDFYREYLQQYGIKAQFVDVGEAEAVEKPCVFITQQDINSEDVLLLKKNKLIAGVGCRRGVAAQQIEKCLQQACKQINYEIEDIKLIASAYLKADEQGILQTAQKYNIQLQFYEADILKKAVLDYGLSESVFVKKQIGVGNVCEAAALANGHSKLILNKTKFEKVTVALAWEK